LTTALPRDIIDKLIALDPAIDPVLVEGSWKLLTPLHEKLGYTAPRVDRDRSYGPDARHRLDIHSTPGQPNAPVFLFAHGGGFVRGDKHIEGTPMYDHVGAWAARHGWVGVTITYRLAPEHTWPSGADDVAAAVAWTRAHIAEYGGDPDRIVVAGHSAGAVHVASFIAGQGSGAADARGGPGPAAADGSLDGVRGAALLSGIYEPGARHPGEHPYFGQLPNQRVSTLPGLLTTEIPLLFSIAERDPGVFHDQAATVVSAWLARHGTMPNVAYVPGHNHISEIGSLGVDDEALGVALARFIDRHAAG
jgi:triacylglycerol lipase